LNWILQSYLCEHFSCFRIRLFNNIESFISSWLWDCIKYLCSIQNCDSLMRSTLYLITFSRHSTLFASHSTSCVLRHLAYRHIGFWGARLFCFCIQHVCGLEWRGADCSQGPFALSRVFCVFSRAWSFLLGFSLPKLDFLIFGPFTREKIIFEYWSDFLENVFLTELTNSDANVDFGVLADSRRAPPCRK